MSMAKFRKKPVEIEAVQWTGQDSYETVRDFAGGSFICWHIHHDAVSLQTPEGVMAAGLGDWIIRGVKGEIYLCKADIFEATYEPVQAGAVARLVDAVRAIERILQEPTP